MLRTITYLMLGLCAVAIAAVGALLALGWHSSLPGRELAEERERASPQQVAAGANLAVVGNCNSCHTAPGGKPFSGGAPLQTPLGTIYGSNLTPDRETGLGTWTLASFTRALREGVSRDGHLLYPAFPYDHFTKLSDGDIQSLYAYFTSLTPVSNPVAAPDFSFPFNLRFLIAGWKMMNFSDARFEPDSSKPDGWNRGAYLVEALAHCGACHTPRNRTYGEDTQARFAGADITGWRAPALNERNPSPVGWSADDLDSYLRNRFARGHGVAGGPMAEVTQNLALADPADVRAIAQYVESLMASTGSAKPNASQVVETAAARSSESTDAQTASIFEGACAGCHRGTSGPPESHALDLSLSAALREPTSMNTLNVLVGGVHPEAGRQGAIMPGFDGILTEPQMKALAGYLRTRFSGAPAWSDLDGGVARARRAVADPSQGSAHLQRSDNGSQQ